MDMNGHYIKYVIVQAGLLAIKQLKNNVQYLIYNLKGSNRVKILQSVITCFQKLMFDLRTKQINSIVIFCFLCSFSLLFFTGPHLHLAGRYHFSFSHRCFEFSCFSSYKIRSWSFSVIHDSVTSKITCFFFSLFFLEHAIQSANCWQIKKKKKKKSEFAFLAFISEFKFLTNPGLS